MPTLNYKTPPLGGLKQDLPSQLLERYYSPDLNGVWLHNGVIKRMPGLEKFAEQMDTGSIQGIYQFNQDNGNDVVLGATTTKIYKIESTGLQYGVAGPGDDRLVIGPDDDYVVLGEGELNWVSIQDSSDFTGGDADFVDMISFFDSSGSEICVIGNGVDTTRKWTGTGNISDLAGTPPKSRYFEVYKNYLFHMYTIEGGTTYPRRVRWSALGNGESYPAEYYLDLTQTTDEVVGGKTLRDLLVVYKENSITLVNYVGGSLLFNTKENYIQGRGALSHRAVQRWSKGSELHFFIGSDLEIYAFDAVTLQARSTNVKSKLLNIDNGYYRYASSVKSEEYDKILWSIPARGLNGAYDLLVYDLKTGSWWIKEDYPIRITTMATVRRGSTISWDTIPYSSWDTFDVPGGWDAIGAADDDTLVLLGCDDGYARFLAAGEDDDGTDIASHYTYPFDNLDGNDDTLKMLTRVYVELTGNLSAGSIRLRVFVDGNETDPAVLNDTGNPYTSISLATDEPNRGTRVVEVDCAVIGYGFSVRLESDSYQWGGRVVKMEYQPIGKGIH